MKPCPECGGVMEKVHGTVTEPVFNPYGGTVMRARPATFYACSQCEHCEEK